MLLRRIARHPITLAAVVALFAAGCILSGQFTIVVNVQNQILYTDEAFNSAEINLTAYDTWDEHKDDIQDIIDVKFELTIENDTDSALTGQVYVSENKYTNATDVQDHATLVVSGIVVDSDTTRTISFTESAKYIANLQKLLDLVESGRFFVYGLAEDSPFYITIKSGARLLITFSAG